MYIELHSLHWGPFDFKVLGLIYSVQWPRFHNLSRMLLQKKLFWELFLHFRLGGSIVPQNFLAAWRTLGSLWLTLLEHHFLLSPSQKNHVYSILMCSYLIENAIAFTFVLLYNIAIQLLFYNTGMVNTNKFLRITCCTNLKPHCI